MVCGYGLDILELQRGSSTDPDYSKNTNGQVGLNDRLTHGSNAVEAQVEPLPRERRRLCVLPSGSTAEKHSASDG